MFQGMNRPLVFLGPSLNREDAHKILDAEYRDPAKKGDFLKLATFSEGKRIIGFVDGVFLHDYPPSPIEVYPAIGNAKYYACRILQPWGIEGR